jgi:steroid 5-alpha reductase family enzyme
MLCCRWGIFIACAITFSGWQWVSITGPIFIMTLLLFVSGVPLQEAQAQARWGSDPSYQQYRQDTGLLLPKPWVLFRPKHRWRGDGWKGVVVVR